MASPTLASRWRTSPEQLQQSWNARPGWGIAANLTPPELISSYRLRRIRERILLAVCLVGLFAAAGFAYGFWRAHQADGDLSAARSQTDALQRQVGQYGSVTTIQGNVAQVRAKLATLLAGDVDVSTLIGKLRAAAPSGIAISALTVTIDDPAASGSAAGSGPTATLDTSGAKHIGSVQINGTGHSIDDLPRFVDAVAALPGVVDVLPTSNATQAVGTKFSLSLTLTDRLFTHRFDVTPPTGGK
ncbi:MAG TPA: hypothetical protein VFE40_15935 [Jatrophihabitantaceae bacterium]|jgi:hypothetical protein|nr:hypothetical protein [Jatrophihabitantaceae bacterium]